MPGRIKRGGSARVYVTLRPDEVRKVHWNNEAEPVKLWVGRGEGMKVSPQLLISEQGEKAESTEARQFEFEVYAGIDAKGAVKLNAYALYYVCEDAGGVCFYLRKDITVNLTVE